VTVLSATERVMVAQSIWPEYSSAMGMRDPNIAEDRRASWPGEKRVR